MGRRPSLHDGYWPPDSPLRGVVPGPDEVVPKPPTPEPRPMPSDDRGAELVPKDDKGLAWVDESHDPAFLWKRKRRRTAKPKDYGYEPIPCPSCKEEIYQRVRLTIICPLGWRNLTKGAIQSPKVQIESASWDDARWFCGCGENPFMGTGKIEPDPLRRNPTKRRKSQEQRPGDRWTKKLKPEDPDPKATKEHPKCKQDGKARKKPGPKRKRRKKRGKKA